MVLQQPRPSILPSLGSVAGPSGIGTPGLGGLPSGGPPPAPPLSGILPGKDIIIPDGVFGEDTNPFAREYPSWMYRRNKDGFRELVTPKTPTKKQFDDWIQADVLRHGQLLARFRRDLRYYRRRLSGVFPGFNPDTDDKHISAEIAIQVEKVCAMISTTPMQINYPNRSRQEREDAQAMEAWAMWFVEQSKVHHRNTENADLLWGMAWYALVYGRIVLQVRPDLEDNSFPWWFNLEDPGTCFPLAGKGKHGMIRMSRQYIAKAGEVLDEFDPTGEKGLGEKLLGKANEDDRDYDLDQDVTVTECDTRWSRYIAVDDIEVLRTDHELGFVPYVYNLVGGEASSSANPIAMDIDEGLHRRDIVRGYGMEGGNREWDLREKGTSFFNNVIPALMRREELYTLYQTSLLQTINPATITTSDYPTLPEPLDLSPGADNHRRGQESTVPAIPHPTPADVTPLLASVEKEIQKGLLPDAFFGQTGESNITGFAQDSLLASAKDKLQPFFNVVQDTWSDALFLASTEFHDVGHATEGLPDGVLIIPRQNRRADFTGGNKAPVMPPWVGEIMQTMIQKTTAPGGPLGPALPPPPAPPPPGPPNPFQRPQAIGAGAPPGASPPAGGAPPGLLGAQPPPVGMMPPMGGPPPMMGPQIGMPGYVKPQWTMTGKPPPGDMPEFRITREIIENIGGRPKVTLNALSLNSKTTLANYLVQMVNAKLMRRETAMEQIPEITDVLAEFEGILAEDAVTNTDLLQMIYYPRSLYAQGDIEGWAVYWAGIMLQKLQEMSMAAMGGMPPPGGGAPPPAPKGQAPLPEPAGAVANQAAAQGQGPGSKGAPVGRPG